MYKNKKEAKEISVKLLRQMHIPDSERIFNEYPHTLSGGTRQRIMLAMALALNPQLLILDEPTTALDVTIQAGILDLLNEIRRSFRTSMIFITHDFGIIAELADIVAVMYAGKIVEQAEAHEIFYNPKHPYTKGLLNSVPRCSEKKDLLLGIEGNVPDLLNLPTGCSFNPRCELACGVCYKKEPELLELAAGHLARCWMAK